MKCSFRYRYPKNMSQFKKFLLLNIGLPFFSVVLWLYSKTLRVRYSQETKAFFGQSSIEPAVVAVWHEWIFTLIPLFAYRDYCAIASSSKDGDYITRILYFFGYNFLRGSSSRGGLRVLRKMLLQNSHYPYYIIAVDGPRGPRREPKLGAFFVAEKLKRPLHALSFVAESSWRLSSWDKHVIPKPLSIVHVHIAKDILSNDFKYKESLSDCINTLKESLKKIS